MNTEFTINVNGSPAKAYLQTGFFDHKNISYPLHKHLFSEIHVFLNGNAVLNCGRQEFDLLAGDILCVPARMEHKYQRFSKDAKRITFLIDSDRNAASSVKAVLPENFASMLCAEIQEYVRTGRDGKLKPLLSYICAFFFDREQTKPIIPITNRELLIDEFFSKKYNKNATIEELSKELKLSKKQTEREVKKVTGNTFVKELSKRRIEAAVILTQTTSLPLSKISEMVGYASYCGFYKAYKRVISSTKKDSPTKIP